MNTEILPNGYNDYLHTLKQRIQEAQIKAVLAANSELIYLYWDIGKSLSEKIEQEKWGSKVIDKIASDLQTNFKNSQGYSRRNLYRTIQFYHAYKNIGQFVPQAVAQIPWGHNSALLEKLTVPEERLWYAQKTIENGWSRNVLLMQIETKLYQRQELNPKNTNFEQTLPSLQSDLVQGLFKDEYVFEFLEMDEARKERDLEKRLVENIQKFMLELGNGFAFMGSQYHVEVGGQDFYIDLLFYHYRLRCLFAIDLKMGSFKPEYAGKMNFYLAVLDDLVKHPDDQPSVGLILCKDRNNIVAEYSLKGMSQPIGIAHHRQSVESELMKELPSPEQFKTLLEDDEE